MKKLALSLALLLVATAALAGDVNYGGHWLLDLDASHNLPPFFKGTTHRINVAQNDSTFFVSLSIEKPGTPAVRDLIEFNLNGRPRTTNTTVHTPNGDIQVPTTRTFTRRRDGGIDITEVRQVKIGDTERDLTSTERWAMSPDGTTLTVHRRDEMPDGAAEYDMVFKRG